MRANKVITLSAVAVLIGGSSLASAQGSLQSGSSMQRGNIGQGTTRGFGHNKSMGSRAGGQKTALESGHARLNRHQGMGPSMGSAQPGGAYARANPRELGEAGQSARERSRLRAMGREIPRLSSVGTELRIDAIVPRSVRMAAAPLPPEIQRMHPHLRRDRAFIYRDQVVILNPATSRIVAIIKTPPKA